MRAKLYRLRSREGIGFTAYGAEDEPVLRLGPITEAELS
jgi:hypothetical protein